MKRSTIIIGLIALGFGVSALVAVASVERDRRSRERRDTILGIEKPQEYTDKDASDARFPPEHHALMRRLNNEIPNKRSLGADDVVLLCRLIERGDAPRLPKDAPRGSDGKVLESAWIPLNMHGLEYLSALRAAVRALQLVETTDAASRASLSGTLLTMLESPNPAVRKDGVTSVLHSRLVRDPSVRGRIERIRDGDEDPEVRKFVALHLGAFDELEPMREKYDAKSGRK